MPTSKRRRLARVAVVALAGAAGWWAWRWLLAIGAAFFGISRARFRGTIGAWA